MILLPLWLWAVLIIGLIVSFVVSGNHSEDGQSDDIESD